VGSEMCIRDRVVPPWVYALLLKDNKFVATAANPAAGQVLANGEVGEVAGFRVLLSNNVPVSSGVYRILAGVPMACTFAEQINKVEAYRPERRFADAVKGLHLYGAKVTRPSGLVLLYGQAAS
ncbi:MAG: P22 coat protein - protein 5 domain protein, partial [Anaerolineae bacterium]|nr:P22 coat protein - protein 5 domain protein [Anaerolineae bacterium]